MKHPLFRALLLAVLIPLPTQAQIDLDRDGLPDLWQRYHNMLTTDPDLDSDGDGATNRDEALAGTDPWSAESTFKITALTESGSLIWQGVGGKRYRIECSPSLTGWQTDMPAMVSSGGTEEMALSLANDGRFWRIVVSDVDQDNDGLTDAEEALLGFDPSDPSSSSATSTGAPISGGDLARAISLLTSGADFTLGNRTVPGVSQTSLDANRFMTHAAIGATLAEINLAADGYEAWIEDQFTKPASLMSPEIVARLDADLDVFDNHKRHAWWKQFLTGEDILRQRVAFALSQIFVISDGASLDSWGMSEYYDMLMRNSFGNLRDLLGDVTLNPTMGIYLSHLKNRKADPSINRYPDENYAREVMQLFTIGLFELNLDGSRKTDPAGNDIPTYSNSDITNFARVFTGLNFGGPGNDPENMYNFIYPMRNYQFPMQIWPAEHDTDQKTLLRGTTLPAFSDQPGRTGLDDVHDALDNLFEHPNVGPFLGRLLIQRLVTSNPSPAYIHRVALAFEDDGTGVRGNLKAVIKAILLDLEARQLTDSVTAGSLREPFLRYARLGRIFTARATTTDYLLPNWSTAEDLGQRWMSAPSVFNFYLPDHQPSGDLTDADLKAPEFQILNAVTAVRGQNYLRRKFDSQSLNEPWVDESERVSFDWNHELSLVDNPSELIDHLDILIAAGQLSTETKATIIDAVSAINLTGLSDPQEIATRRHRRMRTAMMLIHLSPDFAIFR